MTEPFQFACPSCNTVHIAALSDRGTSIDCAKCSKRFRIPFTGIISAPDKAQENYLCLNCHQVGEAVRVRPGNNLIEVILWLAALVPGIIYTIWRSSEQKPRCPTCGSFQLVPASSPRAREIMEGRG